MANNNPSILAGNATLLVWGEVNDDDTDLAALDTWWTNEHLPERLSIPGFQRARRYGGRHRITGHHRYLTLYEVDELATLTSNAYMEKLNNPTTGTREHLPTLARMNRAACRLLHSATRPELRACSHGFGGSLFVAEKIVDGSREDVAARAAERGAEWSREVFGLDTSIIAYHLFLEDAATTAPGSRSQSYQDVDFEQASRVGSTVRMLFLVEGTGLLEQHEEFLAGMLKVDGGDVRSIGSQVYQLMCSFQN